MVVVEWDVDMKVMIGRFVFVHFCVELICDDGSMILAFWAGSASQCGTCSVA